MIKCARLLAVLILAGMPIAAAAQAPQDKVDLDGIVLSLGMAQAGAQSKLAAAFDLRQDATSGTWEVADKRGASRVRASLTFKNGKLAAIKKYWTVERPDTQAALANALFGALSSFEAEGRTACNVETTDAGGRLGEIKSISVVCGHKALLTDIFRDVQGRENVTITETLAGP
jgi:hypothetical protein